MVKIRREKKSASSSQSSSSEVPLRTPERLPPRQQATDAPLADDPTQEDEEEDVENLEYEEQDSQDQKRDSLPSTTKGMQETSIAPTDPLFAPARTTQTYHFHEAES
jgi:hypothetical protein